MDDRQILRQHFAREFAEWEIALTDEFLAAEDGTVWIIVQRGWTIWALFGVDEGGRVYLDYYAMHRMTNDRHVRIFADGTGEGLPVMSEGFRYPGDATAEQKAEAEARFYAYTQEVARLLEEKGFVMTDQAHMSAQVNRYLLTNPKAMDDNAVEDDEDAEGAEPPR